MYIYDNLASDVRKNFLYRLIHIVLLILCDLYCIIILSVGYKAWFLIALILFNFMSVLNGIHYCWNLLDTNDLDKSVDCDGCIPSMDIYVNAVTCVIVVAYFLALILKKTDFISYEFTIILLYGVVYFGIMLYFLYQLSTACYEKIKHTKTIIEERQKQDMLK
jgi:hypothetical protein